MRKYGGQTTLAQIIPWREFMKSERLSEEAEDTKASDYMVKTYEITCPECSESFHVPHSPGKREGATMDCMMCEVTLIFKQRKVLNFHKWLHNQSDGLWPEDGKGTGFVEIRPRTDKPEMPRKGEFIGE